MTMIHDDREITLLPLTVRQTGTSREVHAFRDAGDLRTRDAAGRPVDCAVAHMMGSSDGCATCSLNRLRDQTQPARNGWLQACVITLSIALPVMGGLVVAMLIWN